MHYEKKKHDEAAYHSVASGASSSFCEDRRGADVPGVTNVAHRMPNISILMDLCQPTEGA